MNCELIGVRLFAAFALVHSLCSSDVRQVHYLDYDNWSYLIIYVVVCLWLILVVMIDFRINSLSRVCTSRYHRDPWLQSNEYYVFGLMPYTMVRTSALSWPLVVIKRVCEKYFTLMTHVTICNIASTIICLQISS